MLPPELLSKPLADSFFFSFQPNDFHVESLMQCSHVHSYFWQLDSTFFNASSNSFSFRISHFLLLNFQRKNPGLVLTPLTNFNVSFILLPIPYNAPTALNILFCPVQPFEISDAMVIVTSNPKDLIKELISRLILLIYTSLISYVTSSNFCRSCNIPFIFPHFYTTKYTVNS